MKNKILKVTMTIVVIIFIISFVVVSTTNIIPQIIFAISGMILGLFLVANENYFNKRF